MQYVGYTYGILGTHTVYWVHIQYIGYTYGILGTHTVYWVHIQYIGAQTLRTLPRTITKTKTKTKSIMGNIDTNYTLRVYLV
jgi:hypothetical protein